MNIEIGEYMVQVIILDISGMYAQIHDQGYFDRTLVDDIKKQFSDVQHWRVVVIDREVLSETNFI